MLAGVSAEGDDPVPTPRHRSRGDWLRPLRRLAAVAEVREARWFGRSAIGAVAGTPVLVLESVGRRTAEPHATVLAYFEHDGAWVVAAGAGGQSRVDWVANVRAQPEVAVVVDKVRHLVRAEQPVGVEDHVLRELALGRFPRLQTYERVAGRSAPIFVLRPR